jgi:hypothetical protein
MGVERDVWRAREEIIPFRLSLEAIMECYHLRSRSVEDEGEGGTRTGPDPEGEYDRTTR